jgi:YVTN family beta-propeller protein
VTTTTVLYFFRAPIPTPSGSPVSSSYVTPLGSCAYITANSLIYPTLQSSGSISVGVSPQSVVFNPSGTYAYVLDNGDGSTANQTITVINTATNNVLTAMLMPESLVPVSAAFSPSGGFAYISGSTGGSGLVAVNTASMVKIPGRPYGTIINYGYTPTYYYPGSIATTTGAGVAINPSGTLAYGIDSQSGLVFVVDPTTNQTVNTISVGASPYTSGGGPYAYPQSVAFAPSGAYAYVTDAGTSSVSVINVATNTVTASIGVGSNPIGLAFNPSGTMAYVADQGSSSISAINTATQAVTTISTGAGSAPVGVAVNNQGTLIYVADTGLAQVTVINASTDLILENITTGLDPTSIAISPSGTYAYVTNSGSNTVSIIPISSNLKTPAPPSTTLSYTAVPVASNPVDLAINPQGTLAFVTSAGQSSPSSTPITNIATAGSFGVALNPSGTTAYSVNYAQGSINVINVATNTTTRTITGLGTYTYALALNPSGTAAYVTQIGPTNAGGNNVTVVNLASGTVAKRISVTSIPEGIAINPQGTLAYVTNYGSASVSVISLATNTVTQTIGVASYPTAVAFNPAGTYAYVYSINIQGNGNPAPITSVINPSTGTVVATYSGSTYPFGGAVNPVTGLWLEPSGAGTSLVNPENNVTLATLPVGATSIAINPAGTLAYISSSSGVAAVNLLNIDQNTEPGISIVNLSTDSVIGVIPYGHPGSISFNPVTKAAYVALNPITAFSALAIAPPAGPISKVIGWGLGSLDTLYMPSIAVSPSGQYAYAVINGQYYLHGYVPLNGSTDNWPIQNITTISLSSNNTVSSASFPTVGTLTQGWPARLLLNSAGTWGYLYNVQTHCFNSCLSASFITLSISGSAVTVSKSITVGGATVYPALALNPSDTLAYIGGQTGFCNGQNSGTVYAWCSATVPVTICGSVSIVNVTNPANPTVSNTILLTGPDPSAVALSPTKPLAYVADHESDLISVINTTTDNVVSVYSIPFTPTNMTISQDGKTLYVLSNTSTLYAVKTP